MVYKKYIKRGGKVFGPYYYQSKKINGKVITEYLGDSYSPETKKSPRKFFIAGTVIAFLVLISLALFLNLNFTGMVSSDIQTKYTPGEILKGTLNLNLKSGELLPADSKIVVDFNGKTTEFFLSDFVFENLTSGEFFIENLGVIGEGSGYGVAGSKKIYPNVSFDLEIVNKLNETIEENETAVEITGGSSEETDLGNEEVVVPSDETSEETPVENETPEDSETISEETESAPEETVEEESSSETQEVPTESQEVATQETTESSAIQTSKETAKEIKSESKAEEKTAKEESKGKSPKSESSETASAETSSSSESSSESSGEATPSITGGVISQFSNVISGTASKGNDFEYALEADENAVLVSGSVEANEETIDDSEVKVKNSNSGVVVSANYYSEETGFGEEYLGGKGLTLNVNLESFNLAAENDSVLLIRLVYGETEIVKVEKDISVVEVPEEINQTEILNETIELNETLVNKTEILNETIIENATIADNISTIQYGAVIGKPVKWKKTVTDDDGKVNVEIPKEAENITVYKLNEIVGNESSDNETETETSNETVVEINETEILNETIELNKTVIEKNKTRINETAMKSDKNASIEISASLPEAPTAQENEAISEIPAEGSLITGQFVKKIERTKINANVIAGKVSADVNLESESSIVNFLKKIFGYITGRVIEVTETNESKEVVIDENATEFEIEYVTPAPVAREENTSNGKAITISSETHYENILAYTELPEAVPEWQIKLYRTTDGVRELVEFVGYSENETENAVQGLDNLTTTESPEGVNERINPSENVTCVLNNETNSTDCYVVNCVFNNNTAVAESSSAVVENSSFEQETNLTECEKIPYANETVVKSEKLISYIEWVVPHLSNETYELELVILNVQSYPTVGGNWTVGFNTSGTADLRITAWNGTTCGFEGQTFLKEICEFNETSNETVCDYVNATYDLEYLETKCGNTTLNMTIRINGTDVPYDIYLKKKRIEEIRRELNE